MARLNHTNVYVEPSHFRIVRCQPLFAPIEKEIFYLEFTFPIWSAPPIKIGGSVGFIASFGTSLGGRACLADRRVEMVLTPEATLAVRALATTGTNRRVVCVTSPVAMPLARRCRRACSWTWL